MGKFSCFQYFFQWETSSVISYLLLKCTTIARAPDNFLKQGVADASLEAKGVVLQNPEVFFNSQVFTQGRF